MGEASTPDDPVGTPTSTASTPAVPSDTQAGGRNPQDHPPTPSVPLPPHGEGRGTPIHMITPQLPRSLSPLTGGEGRQSTRSPPNSLGPSPPSRRGARDANPHDHPPTPSVPLPPHGGRGTPPPAHRLLTVSWCGVGGTSVVRAERPGGRVVEGRWRPRPRRPLSHRASPTRTPTRREFVSQPSSLPPSPPRPSLPDALGRPLSPRNVGAPTSPTPPPSPRRSAPSVNPLATDHPTTAISSRRVDLPRPILYIPADL